MAKLQIDGVTVAEIPAQDAKLFLQAAESYGPLSGPLEINTEIDVFAAVILRGNVTFTIRCPFTKEADMGEVGK